MIFYLIGIDHNTTSLKQREFAYRKRDKIARFLSILGNEYAYLSTCNRLEIYGFEQNELTLFENVDFLKKEFPDIFNKAYIKKDEQAIKHCLKLGCGLNSQLIGEYQILEQLKSWVTQDSFPPLLKIIWDKILIIIQEIRNNFSVNDNSNIAKLVLEGLILQASFSRQVEVVVVGTGRIAELLALNKPKGITLHFTFRKRHIKARRLAEICGGRTFPLNNLKSMLIRVDALISATNSSHYLLRVQQGVDIAGKRKRPLYIFDLALPRDIEPGVKKIKGIILKNLDDLQPTFDIQNKLLNNYIQEINLQIESSILIVKKAMEIYVYKNRNTTQSVSIKTG